MRLKNKDLFVMNKLKFLLVFFATLVIKWPTPLLARWLERRFIGLASVLIYLLLSLPWRHEGPALFAATFRGEPAAIAVSSYLLLFAAAILFCWRAASSYRSRGAR